MSHAWTVAIGDQVFVAGQEEEVGAVRAIARDHLLVYIENAGEFHIDGPEVLGAHDGKLVLDPAKLSEPLADAIKKAHAHEND